MGLSHCVILNETLMLLGRTAARNDIFVFQLVCVCVIHCVCVCVCVSVCFFFFPFFFDCLLMNLLDSLSRRREGVKFTNLRREGVEFTNFIIPQTERLVMNILFIFQVQSVDIAAFNKI